MSFQLHLNKIKRIEDLKMALDSNIPEDTKNILKNLSPYKKTT